MWSAGSARARWGRGDERDHEMRVLRQERRRRPRIRAMSGLFGTVFIEREIARSRRQLLDADIARFFDTLSREWLIRFIEHRVGDRRIIRLIRKWRLKSCSAAISWRPRCVLSSIRSTGLVPGADLPRNACLDTRENGMTRICFILLSGLGLAFASGEAWAQAWPSRSVPAVVAFSAGRIVDVTARRCCGYPTRPPRQPVC